MVDRWTQDRRGTTTRRGTALTQTTIARDWKAIRRWLAWCDERRHAEPVEAFTKRRPPREPRRVSAGEIPSPREIERVARELRRRKQHSGALALVVLLATGLRRSELRDLPAENVSGREIKAPPGKGHKERLLPVSAEVARAAREFIALRDAPQGRGRHAHDIGVGLDDHWTGRVLAPACDAAEVPRFGAHDVRRTFATECVRGGVDVLTVQRWMGHTSVNTTQRYLGHYRDDAPVEVPTPRALSIATKGRKR